MAGLLLAPITQIIGIGIPLIGCFALFKKEQTKATLSLFMTNIACLVINYTYLLLITTETADGAITTLKVLYLGNTLFYSAFILFMTNYLNIGGTALRTCLFTAWAFLEAFILFVLWMGDPFHIIFFDIAVRRNEAWGVTFVHTISGPVYWIRNFILLCVLTAGLIYTLIKMFMVKIKEERENLARLAGAQFIIIFALDLSVILRLPFDIVPICSSISVLSIIIQVIHGDFFRVTDQGRNWVVEHTDNILIITDNQYGFLDANPAALVRFPKLKYMTKHRRLPEEIVALFYDYSINVDIDDRHFTKEIESIVQKNKVIGYSMLLIDNTDNYKLMGQIEAEKERAEEANEAKSLFMSNMSHEIRTPMNAIVGMTDILLREELPAQTKEYLNNIKSSGDALLTIINDILDFSKIEAGKMDIIKDEYEPMSMFHDLSMIFLNRVGEKNVEVLYEIDPELPMKLYGDRQRIRQIIINLMNNAIKFTEEGFVKLTVKADPIDEKTLNVTYYIEDSGQGIKEEDINKLFRNFQQVDQEKNKFKEGTGLGLAISKQLVEMMGGTIGVTSEYEKGSCFYFNIPQQIRSDRKAAEMKPDKKETTVIAGKFINPYVLDKFERLVKQYDVKTVAFESVYNGVAKADIVFTDDADLLTLDLCSRMSGCNTKLCMLHNPMQQNLSDKRAILINKPLYSLNFCQIINGESLVSEDEQEVLCFAAPEAKVLIADDNEMNLKVAMGLLAPLKLKIDTAENGKIAVEKVKENHYDLVFMDHMMPIMDGVEALQEIRKLEGDYFRNLPIIALSANATTEAQDYFKEVGFSTFVPKPIKIKEICAAIRDWLPEELIIEQNPEDVQNVQAQDTEELVIEGLNVKEGIENSGSKELFLNLLGDYYKLIDQKSTKVEKCLADGLLRDYTIEVHALKSTSRMIGAMELSDMFYELEQLGNAEDQKTLEMKTPDVISLYRSYKAILEPYGKQKEQEKQSVPIEDILKSLEDLRDSMDSFDLDGADAAMHALEGYAFPEGYQDRIEELSAYVADVAMEEVIKISGELINDLQR